MPFPTRQRISLILVLLLLLLGAWIYFQRFNRVAMENYVPETALGYVEVNDLPHFLESLTNTTAWRQLAPIYGVAKGWQYAGWASRLGRWAGIGTKETLLLSRGQFAVVVNGIEVRGEEVKPRLALVIETHGSATGVRALMSERLPELATRVYQQPIRETSEYAGVPLVIYRAPQGERRILSAGIGSVWIIANDAETLQACIDVRQGRIGAMAKNGLLTPARAEVKDSGEMFAFVSRAGASRLSQFLTHLVLGRALDGTPMAGLPEGLMGEIAQGTVEAMAYSISFSPGGVQDRYAVLCKPEAADSLRAAFRSPSNMTLEQSAALKLVPATAQEVTLVNVDDPGLALDGVERVVSGHLGVAQSFLFHKFFTSARKTFLGLESGAEATAAVGGEVVRFSLTATEADNDKADRIWIVAARNRQKLMQLAERLLQSPEQSLEQRNHQGITITRARDGKRAFAFIGNFLVLSSAEQLLRFIKDHAKTKAWVSTESFTAIRLPAPATASLIYSFRSVAAETEKLMQVVARRMKGKPQADAAPLLQRLPWAVATTSLTAQGLYHEANSPMGNLPLVVAFVDTVF